MLLVLCFNWIHAFALLGRSMQHFNAAIRIMRRLHELGVQFTHRLKLLLKCVVVSPSATIQRCIFLSSCKVARGSSLSIERLP